MSFLKNLLNLHQGEEKKEKVIEDILSNISFRGANLWVLACAILIASIGLNVNSTAVIIGAMLISPLMGPVKRLVIRIWVHIRRIACAPPPTEVAVS